jgi:hypothetical protein
LYALGYSTLRGERSAYLDLKLTTRDASDGVTESAIEKETVATDSPEGTGTTGDPVNVADTAGLVEKTDRSKSAGVSN